jgi:hypothetical protein
MEPYAAGARNTCSGSPSASTIVVTSGRNSQHRCQISDCGGEKQTGHHFKHAKVVVNQCALTSITFKSAAISRSVAMNHRKPCSIVQSAYRDASREYSIFKE